MGNVGKRRKAVQAVGEPQRPQQLCPLGFFSLRGLVPSATPPQLLRMCNLKLQLYYLDCGAGLSLLEAHLEKYRFLRGTEVPSADDLVAREKVEAAGHNLEKYPFPRVRDWIERLRQTDATTTASGEVAVEFLEHSPVNLDYIKQLRSQEEQVALGSSWEFLGTLPGFSGHSGLRGMQQAPAPAASLEIS